MIKNSFGDISKDKLDLYTKYWEYKNEGNTLHIDTDGFITIADVCRVKNEMEEFNTVIEDGLSQHPNDEDLLEVKVEGLMSQERFKEAAEVLDTLELLMPSDGRIYFLRAEMYFKEGNYKEAELFYKKSETLASNMSFRWFNMARCLYIQGKKDEALDCLRKILENTLKGEFKAYKLSVAYEIFFTVEEWEMSIAAIKMLSSLVKKYTYDIYLWRLLRMLYYAEDDVQNAVISNNYIIAIDPDNEEAHTNRIDFYWQYNPKEVEISISFLTDKYKNGGDGNTISTYLSMSKFYEENGELEKAIACLNIIKNMNIEEMSKVEKYVKIAELEYKRDRYISSIASYHSAKVFLMEYISLEKRKFIVGKPNDGSVGEERATDMLSIINSGLSKVYFITGKVEEGLKYAKEAMDNKPNNDKYLCEYIVSLSRYGDADKALDMIEELLFKEPNKIELLFIKAVVLYYMKKRIQAISLFENVFEYSERLKDMAKEIIPDIMEDPQLAKFL